MSLVQTEDQGKARILRLNRPEQRNALNPPLLRELAEALREADASPHVEVVILTGADPAFCGGVDLAAIASGEFMPRPDGSLPAPLPPKALGEVAKPLLAAVNGPAITGGLELALLCDCILASERASFADTHARVGVLPAWGMTALLPRRVGLSRAKQMSLSGDPLDAPEALRIGLVDAVVPHADLLPRAQAFAERLGAGEPKTARAILRLYDDTAPLDLAGALALEWERSLAWKPDLEALERRRAELRAKRYGKG